MEIGDLFEYDEQADVYKSSHKEEFFKMDADSINELKSSYHSEFTISTEYAESLIKEGFLEKVEDEAKPFINIFDEIDTLLTKYKNGLKTLNEDTIDLPACVRVERESVLTNLVTLLEHLKGLKK